jgi:phosphate-selective porin OprO/OprP
LDTPPRATAPPNVRSTPVVPGSREDLEARVRQLEATVQALTNKLNASASPGAAGAASTADAGATAGTAGGLPGAPSRSGGALAPGQALPPNPDVSANFNSPATLENKPGKVKFGPGFAISTDDNEFILQFHNLTQFEYRDYQQGGQMNVKDSFLFPRQWWMFSGRAGANIGYFLSFAHGFDALSLLDVFVDWDVDPRFRLRMGRYKTPFTYEFIMEPVQTLVVPEQSIFFNNFGQNRDLGVMAYGRLFGSQVDYAAGVFNGTRNGYVALDNSKKVTAFVNWHPFGEWQGFLFENFNVGGSVYAGDQQQPDAPQILRTVVAIAGNAVAGVPFLGLNNNVRETGDMAFWDMHMAWFYQQLAVISEWGSGFQTYSTNPVYRTRIPVQAFYVQASYYITGETRSSIGIVKPNNPFSIHNGQWGIGAIEPYFRYEYMDVGSQIFTAGFADPNLWANRVFQTHTGVNWHMTQYVKLTFDWNHAEFNQPVLYAPGKRQLTSDMFMLRFQLFF